MAEEKEATEAGAAEPAADRPSPKSVKGRGVGALQDTVPSSAVDRTFPGRLDQAYALARRAAEIAGESKAESVVVLDMRPVTSLVDFFVVATVPSRRQATAITAQIESEMKKRKESKIGMELSETGRWTLLDYGDVVVHIFSPEGREFYDLDDLWGDAPRIDWKTTTSISAG
jgi:ribosome-associated protein